MPRSVDARKFHGLAGGIEDRLDAPSEAASAKAAAAVGQLEGPQIVLRRRKDLADRGHRLEVEERIAVGLGALQLADPIKRRRADFVIPTGGSLPATRAVVRRIIAACKAARIVG